MVCYDTLVHVPGARAVKDWMIEIKSSATVSGTQKVLVNKHKGQEKWNRPLRVVSLCYESLATVRRSRKLREL